MLAVRAEVALLAAVFQLAVGAGVALRAVLFHLAMDAPVALRAVIFPLPVWQRFISNATNANARTGTPRVSTVSSQRRGVVVDGGRSLTTTKLRLPRR